MHSSKRTQRAGTAEGFCQVSEQYGGRHSCDAPAAPASELPLPCAAVLAAASGLRAVAPSWRCRSASASRQPASPFVFDRSGGAPGRLYCGAGCCAAGPATPTMPAPACTPSAGGRARPTPGVAPVSCVPPSCRAGAPACACASASGASGACCMVRASCANWRARRASEGCAGAIWGAAARGFICKRRAPLGRYGACNLSSSPSRASPDSPVQYENEYVRLQRRASSADSVPCCVSIGRLR